MRGLLAILPPICSAASASTPGARLHCRGAGGNDDWNRGLSLLAVLLRPLLEKLQPPQHHGIAYCLRPAQLGRWLAPVEADPASGVFAGAIDETAEVVHVA